ncbi:hypothetical protein AAG906_002799 [Vitis piasezkii]
MLARLDLALMLAVTKLEIKSNFQLIAKQIQQEYKTNTTRGKGKANALAEIVVTLPINRTIMLPIYLKVTPSITLEPICNSSQTNLRWMLDIIKYL